MSMLKMGLYLFMFKYNKGDNKNVSGTAVPIRET